MSEVKITDLVSKEAIEEIKALDAEIKTLLDTYTNTAKELAKGLDINVKVVGDIDKLEKLLIEKTKEATATQEKLNEAIVRQGQVVANTTNTTARMLMEQERVNKTQREAYTDTDSFKKLLEQVNGSYENRVKRLVETNQAIASNKKQQDDLKKSLDSGRISQEQYNQRLVQLTMQERELKQAKADLTNHLKNEEREMQSVEGSYKNLSQRLELMKKAYKDLTEEERSSPLGKEMETAIQNLDAHLKDVAADMGEFQRNVGNYAIAGQNGVVSTESLTAVLQQQAITMQDVADQTKILEEAKRMLDTSDKHYAETLATINAQIDINKAKLTDVSDIMQKDATSAAEAEAQNNRLKEAMKHIDITADDAQKRIDELNAKIEKNKDVIEQATPMTEKMAKAEKEFAEAAKKAEKAAKEKEKKLKELEKANTTLADQMLSLVGINSNFASSLTSIESKGDGIDGLNTKVKAFGKTLMGLLANPWVLTFLGIGGVVMTVKWLYDYNKGLIEASRLTQNFTGLAGDAADKVTTDVQAIAEHMGKSFDSTIGAANTLVQQFGISWEEALAKIEDGIEAGANMNGRFVENINQFAPALRDAGVSVDEFVSILAETRNGIFDEKGVQDIIKGGTRLRAMTKQIAESLDACGISSKKMQKDLAEGNISMLDAVQQVSAKLKELPENSQEAGMVMKNVFGRTAAEGGTLLVQSIADVNTNLDKAKEKMGDLGRLNREQLEAQKKLNETLASVFKASGTSFEEMTIQAKIYIAQGLTNIIKGCVDIVNWFIRIYNNSRLVRGGVNSIVNSFKSLWETAKFVLNHVIDSFKAAGTIAEGIFTMNWDKVKEGWKDGLTSLKGNVETLMRNLASNTAQAFKNTLNDNMEEITIGFNANIEGGGASQDKPKGSYEPAAKEPTDKEKAKAAKAAEKAAKEELKRIQALEDSKIAVMADGHEKDLALIRQKYKKKLDEIKGNGETEKALRLQLAEQCEKEVDECEQKYQRELSKINIANRLAAVEKGSKEEYDLKMAQLEANREAEIREAEKTGADVNFINAKFNKERQEMQEEFAENRVNQLQKEMQDEANSRNTSFILEAAGLKKEYSEKLKLAGNNNEKREEAEREFQERMANLQADFAIDTINREIDNMQKMLDVSNLSAEERLRIEQELAKKKAELQDKIMDKALRQQDDQNKEAAKSTKEWWDDMKDNPKEFAAFVLSTMAEMLNGITELTSAIFDAQIEQIERLQEAQEEAAEKEQARISDLVEKKVITEEEGEARKRAAEAKSARESEKLEKKKAELKKKQAIWDKANSIAQAGIATALAITQALPNVVLAAIAGAMGALQIATIVATPIPQYAKGTDYHKGGPAIVGDGGRAEIVMFNGEAWLTPNTPTLVDIPQGASVIPDINSFDGNPAGLMKLQVRTLNAHHKPYDDAGIRAGVSELASLLRKQIKTQFAIADMNAFERFKNNI